MLAPELACVLGCPHGVAPSLDCPGWLFHAHNSVCLVVLFHFHEGAQAFVWLWRFV